MKMTVDELKMRLGAISSQEEPINLRKPLMVYAVNGWFETRPSNINITQLWFDKKENEICVSDGYLVIKMPELDDSSEKHLIKVAKANLII